MLSMWRIKPYYSAEYLAKLEFYRRIIARG